MKNFLALILVYVMVIACMPVKAFAINNYTSYNPNDAVTYADTYWISYNTAYPNNGNHDCANFVSQCLVAGELTQTSDWYVRDIKVLGVHIRWEQSDAWAGALALAAYMSDNFTYHNPTVNAYLGYVGTYQSSDTYYLSRLHPGDVILYKWPSSSYHVAIITASSWLDGSLITQHSNDRHDVCYNYKHNGQYILSHNDALQTEFWQHSMSVF